LSPKSSHGILLTFDDGPHPIYTNLLLDELKKENIKAIFFCIGKNIEEYPDIIRRIHNEGHWIGNHTYSHSISWTFSNKKRVLNELIQVENQMTNILGESKKIFRPPFGVTNPIISKACTSLQLKSVTWNIRTYDTLLSIDSILKTLNKTLKGNQIVLLHDNREQCTELTKKIITLCKKKNLTLINPDEAIL
jgi:peptidoglycan/xylan/chitin deacetylase (PgdA/CDA1 family)